MNRYILKILIIVCAGLLWTNTSINAMDTPIAEKGNIFLDQADVDLDKKMFLSGEWQFFWNNLYEPEELNENIGDVEYIQVPSSWKGKVFDNELISNHGFATYRLLIHIPASDIGRNKAILLRNIGSAYQIWIDGQLESGVGVVGTNRAEEEAQLSTNVIFFKPGKENIEIVIQVSNFSFREGGILGEILYGERDLVIPYILKEFFHYILLIGGFLCLGIYHMISYLIRRNEVSLLLIGIGSFALALRTLYVNDYLAYLLFPTVDWRITVKLEYLVELLAFITIILLIKRLFEKEVQQVMVNICYVYVGIVGLYILFTPTYIFTETLFIQVTIMAILLTYFVLYVGIKAAINKREGAHLHLIGFSFIFIAIINDLLYYIHIIDTIPLIGYAVLCYLLLQAMVVSYRYGRIFNRNQELSIELIQLNSNLEETVKKRTKEVAEKNSKLKKMHEDRSKMLSNIAHDIGSPLLGIQSNLYLLKEGKIKAENKAIFQQLIDKSMYIKRLNDDIFELSKLESKNIQLQFEKVSVHEWIKQIEKELKEDLDQEEMKLLPVDYKIMDENIQVWIDPMRIRRVIQNYVNNAVKFSKKKSNTIKLCYTVNKKEGVPKNEAEVKISITDYGTGISKEDLPYVFDRFYRKSEGNSQGSGLGLAIAKEIIDHHGGKVGVSSRYGEETTFFFTLPCIENV